MAKKVNNKRSPRGPRPLKATWSSDYVGLIITFDRPLLATPQFASDWSLVVAGRVRELKHPHVLKPDKLVAQTIGGPRAVGADRLLYAPAEPLLVGADGNKVEPFNDCPLNP